MQGIIGQKIGTESKIQAEGRLENIRIKSNRFNKTYAIRSDLRSLSNAEDSILKNSLDKGSAQLSEVK